MAFLEPSSRREYVRQRAQYCCEYCRIPEEEYLAATAFQEEHIIPKAKFQEDDPRRDDVTNLAWACPRCNRNKSDKVYGADPMTNELIPLFNPRTDIWNVHFLAHRSGHIVGLTPKGRATAEVLRFNDEARVRGRLLLYLRGLWPSL